MPDTDPRCIGKRIAYNQHRQAMSSSPKFVAYIKETLLKPGVGPAGVLFVVDDTKSSMNQFGEVIDLPITSVKNDTGAAVQRFGARHGDISQTTATTLLGGSDKTCISLRALVLAQTNALGGVKADWKRQYLKLQDVGEYGNHEYTCEYRYILAVHLDRSGEKDSIKYILAVHLDRSGEKDSIKRRKVN